MSFENDRLKSIGFIIGDLGVIYSLKSFCIDELLSTEDNIKGIL